MRVGCGCLIYLLIVFPLLLVFILLAAINTWVLDRGFYEEALSDPSFYEAVLEEGTIDWSGTGMAQAFGSVPPFALDAGLRAVITPEHLQSMARTVVNDVFDVMETNADRFTFTFDFTPIKAALGGSGATAFANAYVSALSECEANQDPLPSGSNLPVCREADSESETVSQVEAALPEIAQAIPSQFTYEQEVETSMFEGVPFSLANLRTILTYGVVVTGVVAVFLWLIDGLILGSDGRNRFLWLGLTLLIPAGLVLLAGLGLNASTLEAAIRNNVIRGNTAQDVELAMSAVNTIFGAEGRVRTGFLVAGGIPTLVAVVLLIFGLVIRPGDKRKNNGRYVQVPSR